METKEEKLEFLESKLSDAGISLNDIHLGSDLSNYLIISNKTSNQRSI